MGKLIYFFLIATSSLAYAVESQEIQLADRIEIRTLKDKTRFLSCHLSSCKPLGNANGYTRDELAAKRSAAQEKSGPTGQLIYEGSLGKVAGDKVFAMFTNVVEDEGHSFRSVWCKLNGEISETLKRVSKSDKPADFIFRVPHFKDAHCGAFVETSPSLSEVVQEITTILAQPTP